MEIYILHAGISHPSPYIYNLVEKLKKYKEFEIIINPDLPIESPKSNGIIYFNRLKRFYDSNDLKSANDFMNKIIELKKKNWKILWSIHNFFPIDRRTTEVDEFVVKSFIMEADLLFTLTEYMRKQVKLKYDKESIVHSMGINELNGNFDKGIVDLKALPDDSFLFTFVGNIYKYKQLDEIIKSFERIDDSNTYLLIAGPESKNSGVNVHTLIKDKRILRIPYFIGDSDWKKISNRTNVFLNVYDLNFPAFKNGFFPSNFVKISSYKKISISPNTEIITELLTKEALILYDFDNPNGLYEAMDYAVKNREKLKKLEKQIPDSKYSWNRTTKIFVEGIRGLYEKK